MARAGAVVVEVDASSRDGALKCNAPSVKQGLIMLCSVIVSWCWLLVKLRAMPMKREGLFIDVIVWFIV